jgi:IS30 family transposase
MMQIAAALNRSASSIGREVYRNHSPIGYRAVSASGTNENTKGLVRGFFSKRADFNLVTKEKLNWVQNALKERPRQTLEFNTPKPDHFNFTIMEVLIFA